MKNITAILVDDENKALESLKIKLNRFFSDIEVLETISCPEKAIAIINSTQPSLIFLDIEMPVLSGFDVLSAIEYTNFEVIFVTAYNNYALEAIKKCAIGYVLKPIDNDELKQAVQLALNNIKQVDVNQKNENLLKLLLKSTNQTAKLIIPSDKGLTFVPQDEVYHLEGNSGYTKIHLYDQSNIMSSYNLGKFEKMLQSGFFKCHKSHIVNLQKVKSFEKEGYLVLENGIRVPISKSYKTEFLALFSS